MSVGRERFIYLLRQISGVGEALTHFSKQICHQSFLWIGLEVFKSFQLNLSRWTWQQRCKRVCDRRGLDLFAASHK